MSRPSHVRGEIYTKIFDNVLTRQTITIKEGEQNLRGSVFGIQGAFIAFGLVYDKSVISTPSRKTIEVVFQALLVGTFAVRITQHKIIRILQQSAVTGRKGVNMQGK